MQPDYCKASKEDGAYPKSVIASEDADIFVAMDNDVMVGFIYVRKAQTPPFASVVPHSYAEVIDFFVVLSHREKDIGYLLMGAVKQWGGARNLDYIELSVLSNAEQALGFYERNGFATVSFTMRCLLEDSSASDASDY